MIYRAVVEGGSDRISQMDSFYLFFEAPIGSWRKPLDAICEVLFGKNREHYDVYNVFSDGDLHRQSADTPAFLECHLIESGFVDGRPAYLSERDCVVLLTQESRRKVMNALDTARLFSGTILQEISLERIKATAGYERRSRALSARSDRAEPIKTEVQSEKR